MNSINSVLKCSPPLSDWITLIYVLNWVTIVWWKEWNTLHISLLCLSKYTQVTRVQSVRNPSVILSPTLARNEKVEHYIRIKTHKPIALRFWVESDVSALYGLTQVSLVLWERAQTSVWINEKGKSVFLLLKGNTTRWLFTIRQVSQIKLEILHLWNSDGNNFF